MELFTSAPSPTMHVPLYLHTPKCLYHSQDKYPFALGTVEKVLNLDEAFEHAGRLN